jgi:plasmid maintenance system antidote protein VapI
MGRPSMPPRRPSSPSPISRSLLSGIVVAKGRGVTPDTALRLADLTGTSAEFWMNLQCRYDLWQAAEARARRKESKIQPLAKAS